MNLRERAELRAWQTSLRRLRAYLEDKTISKPVWVWYALGVHDTPEGADGELVSELQNEATKGFIFASALQTLLVERKHEKITAWWAIDKVFLDAPWMEKYVEYEADPVASAIPDSILSILDLDRPRFTQGWLELLVAYQSRRRKPITLKWIDLRLPDAGAFKLLTASIEFAEMLDLLATEMLERPAVVPAIAAPVAQLAEHGPAPDRSAIIAAQSAEPAKRNDEVMVRVLSVFTGGVACLKMEDVAAIVRGPDTVNDKMTSVHRIVPLNQSAADLAKLFGCSKTAIMKTDWWAKNRQGELDRSASIRQERHKQFGGRNG